MTFDTDIAIEDGEPGRQSDTRGMNSKTAYATKGFRSHEEKNFQIPVGESEDLHRLTNLDSLDDLLSFGYESNMEHEALPTFSPATPRTNTNLAENDSELLSDVSAAGYSGQRSFSGTVVLRKSLQLLNPKQELALTKPLYSEHQSLCIFGSNPKAKGFDKQLFETPGSSIKVVRCDLLAESASKSWDLVDEVDLSAPVLDLEWLVPEKSILHCGDHGYYVLDVETMQDVKLTSKANALTQSNLRQTTLNNSKTKFASGGHEKKLTIYSLDTSNGDASPILTQSTDGAISSVSWHPTEKDICSWTTENHAFQIYDCRTGKPAQKLDKKKLQESTCLDPRLQCLYTHGYMTSFQVKLGMQTVTNTSGHGSYLALDLRMFKKASMWYWKDPTLYAVGEIVSSPSRDINACFGRGGVSTWQNDNLTPTGYLGSFNDKEELSTSGVFLNESNIAVTDDTGLLRVFNVRKADFSNISD